MTTNNARMADADAVVIALQFEMSNVKKVFDRSKNAIRSNINTIKKEIKTLSSMPATEVHKQFGRFKGPMLDELKGSLGEAKQQLRDIGISQRETLQPMRENLDKAKNSSQKLSNSIKKNKVEFQGWALSIMFFGMALKRAFDMIWKSSTKTFNSVMHSTEGTVTGFDRLNGSMEYLKFTAGQALEPLVEYMIPIIDKVTEWISENETLFAGLVGFFGVGGTFFSMFGTVTLALFGFKEAFLKAFGVKLGDTKMIKSAKKLGKGGLLKGVAGGVLAFDAIAKFKEGEFAKGFASSVQSAAMWASMAGKGAAAGVLFAAGAAVDFIDILLDGNGTISKDKFASFLVRHGGFLALLNPVAGVSALAIGVLMKVLPGSFVNDVIAVASTAMGAIFTGAIAMFETVLNVIRGILSPLTWVLDKFTDIDTSKMQINYDMTNDALDRMEESAHKWLGADKEAEKRKQTSQTLPIDPTTGGAAIPEFLQVNVELDGKKVADSVTAEQREDLERYMNKNNPYQ